MGFFDRPLREPDDVEDDNPADDFDEFDTAPWIAGVVPLELVVGRSAEAAVVINRIAAYPDGFELTLNSYLHRSVRRRRRQLLHGPMMWGHDVAMGDPIPEEFVRFGIAWPDGGRATNIDNWGEHWADATEPAHGIESRGGGGGGREYSYQYWCWPVPELGTIQFVVEWPAFGIQETATDLDTAVLVDAVGRSAPVWEDDAAVPVHRTRAAMMRSVQDRHESPGAAPGGFVDL